MRTLGESLSRDIIRGNPDVKWESIKGLENAKRLLKEAVVMPIKYPKKRAENDINLTIACSEKLIFLPDLGTLLVFYLHGKVSYFLGLQERERENCEEPTLVREDWVGPSGCYANSSTGQLRWLVRLPSGVQKVIDSRCRATIGIVSNPNHGVRKQRKAGQSRWLGRRPIVRGVALNPVDDPHGGGEECTKAGRPSVSPWGKPTKARFRAGVGKGRNEFMR
ncbi:hypothetical protein RHSIM_Rhsim02G0157400 [Rhododendron simsii]|uniref:Large ribosomal subunit protein uL2 C-terminal domain-containing protein n=1 Tax=Rhododendron simsii TaxID=118357 RepID=A0A834HDI1_RHOSS|nr:hypothetical protein RHSIM_Rhsim02G0157400 [Rhododendron simsii]